MYTIQPSYTGGVTMCVGCMAVYRCTFAVRVYGLLYGTSAQRSGVGGPSNIERNSEGKWCCQAGIPWHPQCDGGLNYV